VRQITGQTVDVEKATRVELITALSSEFDCFEEVNIEHFAFSRHRVRADVVAFPRDVRFAEYALAFECKIPKESWQDKHWAYAARQASDYNFGRIVRDRRFQQFENRRIAASFLFPSPRMSMVTGDANDASTFGIMLLALHFRVGRAFWEQRKNGKRFVVAFGPNEIWRSDTGYAHVADGLIKGKRTLGSQKIDVIQELDGIG
jgi:hypothetical protein